MWRAGLLRKRLAGTWTLILFTSFSPALWAQSGNDTVVAGEDSATPVAGSSEASLPSHSAGPLSNWESETWTEFEADKLIGRTLLVTIGFSAVCLIVLASAQRIKRLGRSRNAAAPTMELLDSLVVGPRCSLQLVRVDDQRFLIAKDGTGLRSVTSLGVFASELDQMDDLTIDAQQSDLGRTSDAGISLEHDHRWRHTRTR